MSKDAWIELPRHRYDKVWDRFDETFEFKPSVRPEDWPTFREPTPSTTWNISDVLTEFNPWLSPLATPYNLALLKALRKCVGEDEPILAPDWQHTSYEFYPHRFRNPDDPKRWLIPALPSGEYHIFVTEDHRLGSLGHPWAQTICVFGEGFFEAYRQATPLEKSKIIRQRATEEKRRRRSGKGSRRRWRRSACGSG